MPLALLDLFSWMYSKGENHSLGDRSGLRREFDLGRGILWVIDGPDVRAT